MTTLQSRDADPAGLPMQTRVGEINSFDEAARTVEVIFTTGATVRRRRYVGWDTAVPFDETLIVSRDAVNMERLLAGAPALDSHSMYSTFSQVGVVDAARIESGKGLATIRFPSKGVDENADRMAAKIGMCPSVTPSTRCGSRHRKKSAKSKSALSRAGRLTKSHS